VTGEGLEGVVTLCLLTRQLKEFKALDASPAGGEYREIVGKCQSGLPDVASGSLDD